MLHRIALYLRIIRSQLRDRNAERALSLRQRLWRGRRLGSCALTLLQDGPPYRRPRWMRR
jgi:hypothetical protein